MIITSPVYTDDNHLIFSRGTIVTDQVITRLKFYDIFDISVSFLDDSNFDDANFDEAKGENQESGLEPEETTYRDHLANSKEYKTFHKKFDTSVQLLEGKVNSILQAQEELDVQHMISDIKTMFSSCRSGIHLFDMLHHLRGYDDLTYVHSVNVALIASMIGNWLQYSKEALDMLMLSALLHDIGKLTIPPEILKKPDRLTDNEYSIVKTHAMRGYNLIRNKKMDNRIKVVPMMHHERCDGSGYPLGLRSEQISEFSKIISIADVYDAMTSSRVYRSPMCPFDVIHIFESEGLSMFDPGMLMLFLNRLVDSYLNTEVLLSNKTKGRIVLINKTMLSRPVIEVENTYIDLSKDSSLNIASLI